jgi:hypothetical protein
MEQLIEYFKKIGWDMDNMKEQNKMQFKKNDKQK